jgi:hypothetical protein
MKVEFVNVRYEVGYSCETTTSMRTTLAWPVAVV